MVYGPTGDTMQVFFFADFAEHPPLGALGGTPGGAASVSKLALDGSEQPLDPIGDTALEPGEWIRGRSPGAGDTATR